MAAAGGFVDSIAPQIQTYTNKVRELAGNNPMGIAMEAQLFSRNLVNSAMQYVQGLFPGMQMPGQTPTTPGQQGQQGTVPQGNQTGQNTDPNVNAPLAQNQQPVYGAGINVGPSSAALAGGGSTGVTPPIVPGGIPGLGGAAGSPKAPVSTPAQRTFSPANVMGNAIKSRVDSRINRAATRIATPGNSALARKAGR